MRKFFNFFRSHSHPKWVPVVGARVVTPKNNVGNIRAIVGDEAWVRTGMGQNVVIKLDLLRSPLD